MNLTPALLCSSCLMLLGGCATVVSSPVTVNRLAPKPPLSSTDDNGGAPATCADGAFSCGEPQSEDSRTARSGRTSPSGAATSGRVTLPPGLTYYLPRQLVKLTVVKTDPNAEKLLTAQNDAKAAAETASAARARFAADIVKVKSLIVENASSEAVRDMLFGELKALEASLVTAKAKESAAVAKAAAATTAIITYRAADAAGQGANALLSIELLPMAPDPDFGFRLDPKHSVFRDDKHKVELATNGLLTSTDIVSVDRTGDILAEIAVLAGYGLGGGVGKSSASRALIDGGLRCDGAPKRIVAIVDLARQDEIDQFNSDVQCMGLKIGTAGRAVRPGVAGSSDDIAPMPGIFYRPIVDVGLRVSYCGLAVCADDQVGWYLRDTISVPLPQFGAISPVPQRAGFMTRTSYQNTFKDGILVAYNADRPSELLAFPRAIAGAIDGGFGAISKVISLRTGANTSRVAMSASERATLQARERDAEKLRLYEKCREEKLSTQSPLSPCFDLLD